MDLGAIWSVLKNFNLSEANRPIRMRLAHDRGMLDDVLMVQRVEGKETICGGLEYRLFCVSPNADLPLKDFIALPVEIQFVTDMGQTRSVCGVVTSAQAGESDGGLATYKLEVRDGLFILEKRINTRKFMKASVMDITHTLLQEWRGKNTILTRAFDINVAKITGTYPTREFTMQHNESDAAFLRRLWKRAGISWYIQPASVSDRARQQDDTPLHKVILFDDAATLEPNRAGVVRYHRNNATEQRDSITAWSGVRTLASGSVTRQSWDYQQTALMMAQETSRHDQGKEGNSLAASLDDYVLDIPHAGDDLADYQRLGQLQMLRHELEAKCFTGESGVRDFCVGQWNTIAGHAELQGHNLSEQQFIITELMVEAENNLPKDLGNQIRQQFMDNGWLDLGLSKVTDVKNSPKYHNRFTAVRRGIAIVPHFDPQTDLPRPQLQTAIVVGPAGEEVHCDEHGRIKVRFPGTRAEDHQHAGGAGASDTDSDSAWIRVITPWAGEGWGAISLPRVGQEVLVDFLGGDPDKPIILGSVYNGSHQPPAFTHKGQLPDNRYVSGTKSKEVGGNRYNQLRIDDTPGQISAQLASEHGHSQLNLGYLTQPREQGKGAVRGEGVELRTDLLMAMRSAMGILLSAWKDLQANGTAQACAEAHALMHECESLFDGLGKYCTEHQGLPVDDTGYKTVHQHVKGWEGGLNTAPKDQPPESAPIAMTAPGGISLTTREGIIQYAAKNFDAVAQQHLQWTAGQRFNLNAGKGISLFSHADGLRTIAHQGPYIAQAQNDSILMDAAKDVTIRAVNTLTLMAKEIRIISEDGSFVKLDSNVTLGSNGSIAQKGSSFPSSGPATMGAELPNFSSGPVDQHFILKNHAGTSEATPAANRKYRAEGVDGKVIEGITDAKGATQLLQSEMMQIAHIHLLPDE